MKNLGSLKTEILLIVILMCSLFSLNVQASVNVKTELSNTNLEVGDQLTYKIIISSDERLIRPGAKFKPPVIKGLDYMGISESSSTGISFQNFKKTATYTTTMSINYSCLKEGAYTVKPLRLDIPGGERTKAVRFKVYTKLPAHLQKQKAVKRRRRGGIGGGMGSLLDQFMGNMGGMSQNFQGAKDFTPEFFTKVEVDKSEVYAGEQVIATWYVYLSPNTALSSFDTLEFPTLRGFWKEDVHFSSRFFWKPSILNGKTYMRAVLSSYALTPYNSGDLLIDSFKLRVVASQQRFFSPNRKVLNAVSEKVKIKVKELPKPVPASFFGGVGRFKIDGGRGREGIEVLYGEPYVYQIRIIGDRANTKFLKVPRLDLGKEFSLYNTEEDFVFLPQKVSSYKDFKYTLIPKKEGVLRIPELKVSFLNPESGEYYAVYVKPPVFKVLPNEQIKKIKDADFGDKPEEKVAVKDLKLQPKKGKSFVDFLYGHIPYRIQVLILVLALGLCFWVYRTKSKVMGSASAPLIKQLEERTHNAAKILREGRQKEALDELINIYSLLIGGVSGKRFGVEEEFSKAAENLPPSLKSESESLKSLNANLQELRFGARLESKENQAKLKECLERFKSLFSEVREYLR